MPKFRGSFGTCNKISLVCFPKWNLNSGSEKNAAFLKGQHKKKVTEGTSRNVSRQLVMTTYVCKIRFFQPVEEGKFDFSFCGQQSGSNLCCSQFKKPNQQLFAIKINALKN